MGGGRPAFGDHNTVSLLPPSPRRRLCAPITRELSTVLNWAPREGVWRGGGEGTRCRECRVSCFFFLSFFSSPLSLLQPTSLLWWPTALGIQASEPKREASTTEPWFSAKALHPLEPQLLPV